jgi:ABC-2 type transport system permease protein
MARLRLILTYVRLSVLNELQYRVNFVTSLIESVLGLTLSLGALLLVFQHTDTLAGWTAHELLALVGIYYLMGSFIGAFVQPSMELLLNDVRKGTLDFTLTKPEDAQVLVSVRSVAVWKLIDALLGVALIVVALRRSGMDFGFVQGAASALALMLGMVIIYSFWLMLATIAFWFIKIENILVIFQSMYQAGRWPVGIYPPFLRLLLTFLVPVAFAVTVPAEALTGRATWATLLGATALAAAILAAARAFWRVGVRHYAGASA